jgi:hypothetical protein
MTDSKIIDEFKKEVEVRYRNESYKVRDNGSVFRLPKTGRKTRPYDDKWMFGNEGKSHPYLTISGERVHRIVATAFHGEPPGPEYVVDHIDTNCRNNRPENLRWITRLENALLNPITRKKIEYHCGSIEAFLENPSMLNKLRKDSSFKWMRAVTLEEAQACKERMLNWARAERDQTTGTEATKGLLGEWLFRLKGNSNSFEAGESLTKSLTENCLQENWRVPSSFPCCPIEIGKDSLQSYFTRLNPGEVFSSNDKYPEAFIVDKAYNQDKSSVIVLCARDGIKPWALSEIKFDSGNYIHSNLGSYFSKEGADKYFCLEQGLEWTGEDSIDDFC